MKKLITVLCLMATLAGAGQKDTSYANLIAHDSIIRLYPIGIYYDSIPKPKYDTIPIIYLYCDTARLMSVTEGLYLKNDTFFRERDTAYYSPNNFTFWDFGYEVRQVQAWFHPIHIRYLDRQKNPIRKSMIIWQTKTISNEARNYP